MNEFTISTTMLLGCMDISLAKISKFLSYVLRHKPEAIGLELDAEGWASIQVIINKADMPIDRSIIEQAVSTNDKQRFALSEDGQYIRANQGHSIDINLGLKPKAPPVDLYHGTAKRFLENILCEGLKPQNRQYVHLSPDEETAHKVGQRHGSPVILKIPALEMHKSGHEFFLTENGIWLIKNVSAKYLNR